MKRIRAHTGKFPHRLGNRRGVALISVLAVLILLTVLVVAFLMRAQVARTSSATYRATTGTRLLGDTVINLVQAEINDATTYGQVNGTTGSSLNTAGTGPFTWASQPGAVRVFDSTGALTRIYRLYSAPSLTGTSSSEFMDGNGNTKEVPTTWINSPAAWTDLNAPVTVNDPDKTNGGTTASITVYPIMDNRDPITLTSSFSQCVQMPGFFVNALGTSTFPTANTTTLNQPVMPVQWLYVLQDGHIIAPDSSNSGNTVTFKNAVTTPTGTNQIVGRIAYWTDDDTCKININTAAGSVSTQMDNNLAPRYVDDGGVFMSSSNYTGNQPPAAWDVPRFGGSWPDLRLFALNQPVAGEYQRFPGHPATTILYYTLNALGIALPQTNYINVNSYGKAYNSTTDTQHGGNAVYPYTSTLYGMLPRYNDNSGSQNGLANTTASTASIVIPNRKRLYTSLGELLYSTYGTTSGSFTRTLNGTLSTSNNPTPTGSNLVRQQIETGKFLLTAHSRAPETTLFGTPRIAMWPIPDPNHTSSLSTTGTLTALDKLIAICATTDTGNGGTPSQYYFQRYDAYSNTNDWVNEPRNQSLYGYLKDLTSANIPGYGGNFLAKYSVKNERDQILTEIVDYIRTLNLNDHSWGAYNASTGTGVVSINNPIPTGRSTYAAKGEVFPLQITSSGSTTQGLGRLATLSEIGLLVICTADGNNNLAAVNSGNSNPNYTTANILPAGATDTGTSVAYRKAYSPAGFGTYLVSPVVGSASDPAYVSNLPVPQFLRTPTGTDTDGNPGTIVDIYNNPVTAGSASSSTMFPANPTLSAGDYTSNTSSYTPVAPGQKMLQAALLPEPAVPMAGYNMLQLTGGSGPDFNMLITGLNNIVIAGQNPFPARAAANSGANSNGDGYLNGTPTNNNLVFGGNGYQGGILGMHATVLNSKIGRYNGWSGLGPLTATAGGTDTLGSTSATRWTQGAGSGYPYRFVSNPFTVSSSTGTMSLGTSATSTFSISMTLAVSTGNQVPYQTFYVSFPQPTIVGVPIGVPIPTLITYGLSSPISGPGASHAPDWWGFDNRLGWTNYSLINASSINPANATGSLTLGWSTILRGDLQPPSYWLPTLSTTWTWKNAVANIPVNATTYGDVERSIVPKDCDFRLTAARMNVDANPANSTSDFMVTPNYTSGLKMDNMFMESPMYPFSGYSQVTPGAEVNGSLVNLTSSGTTQNIGYTPKVPYNYTTGATDYPGGTVNQGYLTSWDWDNGVFQAQAGAYANKADEGTADSGGTGIPYINANSGNNGGTATPSYFVANRIVASPVAFCSLPTGVTEGIPWRTLHFRPQQSTAAGGGRNAIDDPSSGSSRYPEDELLLDNFWMPVVQPYAISEPFSTAGKINMNYQILPFTYITRSTAVQAVLASELIARVPIKTVGSSGFGTLIAQGGYVTAATTQAATYAPDIAAGLQTYPDRLPVELSEVYGSLRQFRAKFTSGDIFRSAAEICDIYLVPTDSVNPARYKGWYTSGTPSDNTNADHGQRDSWYGADGDFALVGNNTRCRPYNGMYPRLTTKSNSYTVYYKVQTLKNPPAANQSQWTEGSGVVTGEYRGSTSLERYLDPTNTSIPDYTNSSLNPAHDASKPSLDNYYQWRTVSNNTFSP